nr:hypothetical protein [Bradyrhizobium sp. 195]
MEDAVPDHSAFSRARNECERLPKKGVTARMISDLAN